VRTARQHALLCTDLAAGLACSAPVRLPDGM